MRVRGRSKKNKNYSQCEKKKDNLSTEGKDYG